VPGIPSSPLELSAVEADAALASTVAGNQDRWPALAVLAALRRKTLADGSAVLTLASRQRRSAQQGSGGYSDDDEEEEEEDEEGPRDSGGSGSGANSGGGNSTLAFLDALRPSQTYTPVALSLR